MNDVGAGEKCRPAPDSSGPKIGPGPKSEVEYRNGFPHFGREGSLGLPESNRGLNSTALLREGELVYEPFDASSASAPEDMSDGRRALWRHRGRKGPVNPMLDQPSPHASMNWA
jgi:hypothetical protein